MASYHYGCLTVLHFFALLWIISIVWPTKVEDNVWRSFSDVRYVPSQKIRLVDLEAMRKSPNGNQKTISTTMPLIFPLGMSSTGTLPTSGIVLSS